MEPIGFRKDVFGPKTVTPSAKRQVIEVLVAEHDAGAARCRANRTMPATQTV